MRILGMLGNGIRRLGEFGSNIARKVGQFAAPIGAAVGGLVGGNIGNTIKSIGQGVANFASGPGMAIAKGVSDVGSSLQSFSGGGMKTG